MKIPVWLQYVLRIGIALVLVLKGYFWLVVVIAVISLIWKEISLRKVKTKGK
jgi:cell division septal protein FtsQ